MRCQRCGFEIEPGQTFCSMCGTEQSKALREPKKKIESIFGIIKVVSKNHLKMYINLALAILLLLYIIYVNDSPINLAYICCDAMIILYALFQCLVPFKNPNSSKSKAYKYSVRVVFGCILVLTLVILFTGTYSIMDLVKKIL